MQSVIFYLHRNYELQLQPQQLLIFCLMKSAFCFIAVVLLTEIMQLAYSLTCNTYFQQVPYGTGSYCAKCDTTCATCSGSSINACSTCPTDFTLNSGTATCTAPISSTINTVISSYHSYGFEKESTWWGGDASSWSSCGTITVLHGGAGDYIKTYHSLSIHYKIRIMASLWTFAGANDVVVAVVANLTSASISSTTYTVSSNADYPGLQTYYPYCATAFANNIDISITDATAKVIVSFSSAASTSWGVREYIFIEYLCYQPDCASCNGPASTQCLTCTDSNKVIYTLPTAGPCLCNYTLGYYAYPTNNSTYYCVNPCPNLPTGQYFGDNTTYSCVTSCPAVSSNPLWGLSFASDTYGICVLICPLTITIGGKTVPIYYDIVNRKCTTACPTTQPYSFWVDRACYAACPLSGGKQYYMLNTNMSCVDVCPNVTQNGSVVIPLYRDTLLLVCVQICPSNGYYGYLNTATGDRYCTLTCPNPLFSDNSTGRPLCTKICPSPNYFGDPQTLPPACVLICSFGTYGDMADANRQCVTKCNGSYYGIMSGNRTCVVKCPSGSWGERLSQVCLVAPFQCLQITITFSSAVVYTNYSFNTFINSFVDNTTNMCIWANESCSNGMFKLNSSYTCEQTCPSGTFANLITYWCVSACYGLYFADSTLNQCVLVCSPGLYADIGSGNKCVSGCNQSAAYPFKDISIRSCVGICVDGYADPIAQACVFNCSAGLYLNNSVPTQRTCTTACTGSYYAYNNSESGICVMICPDYPPLFGDVVSTLNVCVQVCSVGLFGDQTSYGSRHCVPNCPNGTFAQNDNSRLCVTRCNSTTYGRTTDWTCVNQQQCPENFTGDPTTNLCTNLCPTSAGTFADNISKLCVSKCPVSGATIYYADIHLRWCISVCQSTKLQFGNNSTQTCEVNCLDLNSYADAQSSYRYCIALCTNVGLTLYYRDNSSMVCVVSTGCSYQYFGDNSTAHCVEKCPVVTGVQTWGYKLTKTCVSLCYASTWGDASTGIPLCVSQCPSVPPAWSYNGPSNNNTMLCKQVCPTPYFGEDFNRTCILLCPRPPTVTNQTYAYDGTRRCLAICPNTTYADYISGVCFQYPINCSQICGYGWTNCTTFRWADPYNTSCTFLCTATPWDTYGDNLTYSCTTNCSASSWADNYTGTRICVAVCPGIYTSMGVVVGSYDSYGDNYTKRCVLTCQQPSTFADWQTHLCTFRCTGDNASWIPTYANIFTLRCVVALSCPVTPDKYFGQNVTRNCLPSCVFNATYKSYADNISRTCIPVCYNFTNGSTFTMFYGDSSTLRPACVIACAESPVQFGSNNSHLCVSQCIDQQYGDQTGNRTCVKVCPNIGGVTWFSQITKRICVLVCENGTYGNFYNFIGPHCQTVGTDCNITYYGDSSTSMCVPICPLSMNYYGDPSTRLCVSRCPLLSAAVVNSTAGINLVAGRLFADYSTRLCVYMCPSNYSNQGTFGDNSTNTCVGQCPIGSFGDANTTNRFCVANCTGGAFADNLTMLCVQICPASPPTFGFTGNYTCVSACPANLWADSITRTCVSICSTNFRFTNNSQNTCVSVCPSNPDLYGDTQSYNCTAVCSNGQFADPSDRLCKSNCSQNALFQYNYRCVKFCPKGYYANEQSNCVNQTSCDSGTYGDNETTKCVNPCPAGSFSDPISRYCIAVCPSGSYGDNLQCVTSCQTPGTNSSNITQVCAALCPNYTYAYGGACQTNCTGSTYQNDQTHSCNTACPNGLFGDPTSRRCVAYCPTAYYRKTTGYCVAQNSGCNSQFADFITGNCVSKCSTGYWGYKGNYTCMAACPSGMNLFGYASATQRTCYAPLSEPITTPIFFADQVSGQFVSVCPETPTIYFGDSNRHTCVPVCLPYNSVSYYGDPHTRQCQSSCIMNATYTADPATSLCTLKCTFGSFRNNDTGFCVSPCPVIQGYGDYSIRTCVAICPISANTFGFYNISSGSRLCLVTCPNTYYADPGSRTCLSMCPSSYAQNATRSCVPFCISSFADDSNNICVPQCLSLAYPNADNSTNKCVFRCPESPDYYADSNVCVFYCTTANYFADTNGRLCVSRCTNFSSFQYGDPRTGRCEVNCSEGTWGENSTNLCVPQCPVGSFADNTTGKCVAECPKIQNIYADMILHVCAYTCSNGYFGSQVNQTCIRVCDNNYWGDPTTTLCIDRCPVKIYSFGQNVSRTCVTSCFGYTGYADNYSRLCRENCQNTTNPQTYADPTTLSCVQICPQGYYSYSVTNLCLTKCLGGSFADNFSQSCVPQCPSQPESYGDQTLFVCIYSCLGGQFSDNSTNLCVGQCPGLNTSSVDYYGDKVTGRCVKWCTEGTYAQNSSRQCVGVCPTDEFADNFTRRCVQYCPPSQFTYADPISHACVRICPANSWAQNTTQSCVTACWRYGNLTESYADNISNYCVAQCPFGYFGSNSSHSCVTTCSLTLNQYGHYIGRVCVAVTNCYRDNSTGIPQYADYTTQKCVDICPLTLWADTHIFKCVPACNSLLPEFRNNHTQTCVWPCPSDPDEFADSTTGNCVRTCPFGYYAYTGNRTCVSSCADFSLFADNTTNRCVSVCATNPYLYADILVSKCVHHCSGGYFSDNTTQRCVPICSAASVFFGQLTNYTCVSLCPSGLFADALNNRTCRSTCSNNYFSDNFTATCVQHCSLVLPYYYEDTSLGHGVCVLVCPGESYAYNPNQTCRYQNTTTLASTCPSPYYADRLSRQCVKFCPNRTFAFSVTVYCEQRCSGIYYADPILRQCVTTCSPNLFKYQLSAISNLCVQYCPSSLFAQNLTNSSDAACVGTCTGLVGLPTTWTCESYCPYPYFANWNSSLCISNCTPNYAYLPNRTCLSTCEAPYYGNPLTKTCDMVCPSGYFGRNDTRMCSTGCPNFSYADPSIRICVSSCPSFPLLYADDGTNQCLQICPGTKFGFMGNRTCLGSCPNISSLIYLADGSNRLCVLQCVNALLSFADYLHNVCTDPCPPGYFASNYTKECVLVCPNDPNDTFSDNDSSICMAVCQPGSFGNHDTLNCVLQCVLPYFADPTTRTCVKFCPDGHFAQNTTASCLTSCSVSSSYADPVSHRCLAQCPALQNYFNYHGNWTCLLACPPSFYANTDLQACLSICNSSTGMFSYFPTSLCVRECPIPYRGYTPNMSCVLNCPTQNYFYDVTINRCGLCDNKCLICVSATSCTQCKPGFNLFNGNCDLTCIPTNIITYANPSGQCVTLCPPGYYGDNSSYSCTQNCPNKLYGDSATRLCLNCPGTCATCSSFTYCMSCAAAATLSLVDHMCYSDCNSTYKYSYNGSCWNQCPNSTYLTYTNVLCAVCSAACKSCSSSGTNCTSCATTYYLNFSCLTTCPSGYYGAPSLQCLSCNSSADAAKACANPLSFSTSMSVENYQYVITLQFNQNVSIKDQLSNILKINLKAKRRMIQQQLQSIAATQRWLSISTLINNGVTYTYEILSNGTIKLYLNLDTSLINPTFSVDISDPGAIVSTLTGVSLQNVQSLISTAMIEYYSPADGKDAGTNFPAEFAVVAVLLLYVLTFIFSDCMVRPIQVLQLLFLHCLINVQVPANFYYFLLRLQPSVLGFVVNWFKGYFPGKAVYYDTPQKIVDVFVDYVFLRNVGQIFVLIVILGSLWFVFLLLENKRIVSHKIWHKFLEEVSQKRYQLMVVNDVITLFYLPILYFGFLQLQHLFGEGIYGFNVFATLLFVIAALAMPFVWLLVWFKVPVETFKQRLWFLTLRVTPNEGEAEPIHEVHEVKSEEKLKEEKGSADGVLSAPLPTRNKNYLQSIVFSFYLLLMVVWLVSLYSSPRSQLILLICTNIAFLVYTIKFRPFLNNINLIFTILTTLTFIGFEAFYLFFLGVQGTMYASEKTTLAYPFVVTACTVVILIILWALWRFVWEVMFYWQNFKKTELYLQFADHDYVGEDEQKTEQYSEYAKMAQNIDAGLGDVFVEKIMQELNQEGQKVIRVTKKVLKRKKRAYEGRKKQVVEQMEAVSQEDDDDLGYVRVNQMNVFDYDKRFQKLEPEPQPLVKKGTIDDDIREIVSDHYNQYEEEKKVDESEGRSISYAEDFDNRHEQLPSQNLVVDEIRSQEEKMKEEEANKGEPESYPVDFEIAERKEQPSPRHEAQQPYEQIKSQSIAEAPQPKQESSNVHTISLDYLPQEDAAPIKNLQDLLQEQQQTKKNKKGLLFLFEDFDE